MEFPHTDFVDRAEDFRRIVVDPLGRRLRPVMSTVDCRMMEVYPTLREPRRGVVDQLIRIEATDPQGLSLSAIQRFLAGDVTGMNPRMIAMTDGDADHAAAVAERLGIEFCANRGRHVMPVPVPDPDPDAVVALAMTATAHPIVMAVFGTIPAMVPRAKRRSSSRRSCRRTNRTMQSARYGIPLP